MPKKGKDVENMVKSRPAALTRARAVVSSLPWRARHPRARKSLTYISNGSRRFQRILFQRSLSSGRDDGRVDRSWVRSATSQSGKQTPARRVHPLASEKNDAATRPLVQIYRRTADKLQKRTYQAVISTLFATYLRLPRRTRPR